MSFFFFFFFVTQNHWVFPCLSPFYHELVNERANEILKLTKMQEGEDVHLGKEHLE